MTRSWQFTLPLANTWYNLWTLITSDSTFTDPTFTNAPYMPSKVCELYIYAATGNMNYSSDIRNEVGTPIYTGGFYKKSSEKNIINLMSSSIQCTTANGVINVDISSN